MTTSAAPAASSTLRSGEERARPPNLLLQQDQRSQYSVIVILVVMLFQNTNKRLRRRARKIGIASLKANDTYRWRHQRLNKYFSVKNRSSSRQEFLLHCSCCQPYKWKHDEDIRPRSRKDGGQFTASRWMSYRHVHSSRKASNFLLYLKIWQTEY